MSFHSSPSKISPIHSHSPSFTSLSSSPEEHILYGLEEEEYPDDIDVGEEEPSLTDLERNESFNKGAFMDWIRSVCSFFLFLSHFFISPLSFSPSFPSFPIIRALELQH